MEEEIWKDIPWYEWLYQVSNLWDIKSLWKWLSNNSKIRILKKSIEWWWYFFVKLYKEYIPKNYKIHRAVALSFIPNPNNLSQVNHKDWNKLNNNVSNLEWCTRSENIKHAFSIGLSVISEGQKKRFSLMSKSQVGIKNPSARKIINIETGEVFDTIKEVVEKIGIKRTTFQAMLNGQNPNKTKFIYYG